MDKWDALVLMTFMIVIGAVLVALALSGSIK